MADFVRGERKNERNSVLGIAIDAVRPDLCHERGNRFGPGSSRVACSLIPHHHREQNANTPLVKVRDHLSNSNDSSRHAVDHVDLVPIDMIHCMRSEEHTSELQSLTNLVCRLLLEKKKKKKKK